MSWRWPRSRAEFERYRRRRLTAVAEEKRRDWIRICLYLLAVLAALLYALAKLI